MCVKLLLTPLIDPREFEKVTNSMQFVETPTSMTGRMISEKSEYVYYENKLRASAMRTPSSMAQKQLAGQLASFPATEKKHADSGMKTEHLSTRYSRKSSELSIDTSVAMLEDNQNPGNIRRKVVKAEVNGQWVWEVSHDLCMGPMVEVGTHPPSQVRPVSPAAPQTGVQGTPQTPRNP